MNSLFKIFEVALLAICFNSCTSSEIDYVEESFSNDKVDALVAFDKAFKGNFDDMVITRSAIIKAEDSEYEEMMAQSGRKICMNLKPSSNMLLQKFGLTDEILLEVYNENKDCFNGETNFEEFKCFTSLTIYDVYQADNKASGKLVDAVDVISCIGVGVTTKQFFDLPARKIAMFTVKKLAAKLIPYVGWGWGVASAAYCLSKL